LDSALRVGVRFDFDDFALVPSRRRFGFLRFGFDDRVSVSATWIWLFRLGFGNLAWATWLRRFGFDVSVSAVRPGQFGVGDLAFLWRFGSADLVW
jgi:hypothetical protein